MTSACRSGRARRFSVLVLLLLLFVVLAVVLASDFATAVSAAAADEAGDDAQEIDGDIDAAFVTALLAALSDGPDSGDVHDDGDDEMISVEMIGEDDDDDENDVDGGDASHSDTPPRVKMGWFSLQPPPLTWSQFVRRLQSEHCLQMPAWWDTVNTSVAADAQGAPSTHQHHNQSDDDDEAVRTAHHLQRYRHNAFCRRPVVLVSTWLPDGRHPAHAAFSPVTDEATGECASCEWFIKQLVSKGHGELTMLFPAHATLVLVDDPMRTSLLAESHLHLLPDLVAHSGTARADGTAIVIEDAARTRLRQQIDAQCAQEVRARTRTHSSPAHEAALARFGRECAETVTARVLKRVAASVASPFVPGSEASDALVTPTEWVSWERAAFEAQGSYAVRALFLYPHNGSVMRHVVNEDVWNGDPSHVHFYLSGEAFLRSVRRAIWTMQQLATKGRLYD